MAGNGVLDQTMSSNCASYISYSSPVGQDFAFCARFRYLFRSVSMFWGLSSSHLCYRPLKPPTSNTSLGMRLVLRNPTWTTLRSSLLCNLPSSRTADNSLLQPAPVLLISLSALAVVEPSAYLTVPGPPRMRVCTHVHGHRRGRAVTAPHSLSKRGTINSIGQTIYGSQELKTSRDLGGDGNLSIPTPPISYDNFGVDILRNLLNLTDKVQPSCPTRHPASLDMTNENEPPASVLGRRQHQNALQLGPRKRP